MYVWLNDGKSVFKDQNNKGVIQENENNYYDYDLHKIYHNVIVQGPLNGTRDETLMMDGLRFF